MSGSITHCLRVGAVVAMLGSVAPIQALAAPEAGRNAERTAFTAGELASSRQADIAAPVRIAGDDTAAFQALIGKAPRAGDPWLVISGGGENGAFAAGILAGWSQSGGRPDFGVITGVSTGALIAPFAFIGQRGDAALREAYTTISASDVFEFGGTDESLTDTWPLKKRIDKAVTADLLKAVAAENAKGRRLLVATTELDSERPVLWDMGAIAQAGTPKALSLFRAIVLASSAVPGIFPPVMIDAASPDGKTFQEMHADGGTTAPFYLAPAAAIDGSAGLRLPASRVYLIVNNKLTPYFQMARRDTLSVLGRSLSAAIKAQTRAALSLSRSFAERSGLDLEVAEIDGRFTKETPAPFDRDYMRALFAHGESLARNGSAFAPAATEMQAHDASDGRDLATGSNRRQPAPPQQEVANR